MIEGKSMFIKTLSSDQMYKLFPYLDIIYINYNKYKSLDTFQYTPNDKHSFEVLIDNPPIDVEVKKFFNRSSFFQIILDHLFGPFYIDRITIRYNGESSNGNLYHHYHYSQFRVLDTLTKDPNFFWISSKRFNWNELIKIIKLLSIKYI